MIGNTNIRTLAKELNLSIGTVSKALRNSYEISAQTKEKVLALAKQLKYTPNPYASSLRRKKSNTIGVVIPEVADSFFSQAIRGIESVAQKKGYHVLIYLTYESFSKEEAILKDFNSGRVDGVLVSVATETSSNSHINELRDKDIPVVFFDRVLDDIATYKVSTNDFESCQQATTYLIEKGCRRLAYLSISKELSINKKRMEGFQKAIEQNQNKIKSSVIVECSNNNEKNYETVNKIMQAKNHPDGIIASVEKLTAPIYLVCKDLSIDIPQKIKVISFSNLETAVILNPSLTTVTQPAYEMGKMAADLLFKIIEKKKHQPKNEHIVIASSLTVRAST
jgi:LacI family transcriptional regulator